MKTRSLLSSITAAISRCFSRPASLLLVLIGVIQLSARSQTPADCKVQCTANDVRIVSAYLVQFNSMQKLPTNYVCDGPTADTRIALELTTNTPRVGVAIYADIVQLKQDGTVDHVLQTVSECFFNALQSVQNNKVVFHDKFVWTCGMPIALTNVYIAWGTGQENFCLGSDAFRCPETPSKCYQLPAGQYISIETPVGHTASAELCSTTPGGNTATFNLTSLESTVTGNQPNVAVAWYTDEALISPITTPSSFTTASTTVYAKVYNIQAPTAYVKEPVTLTVNTTPTASTASSILCSSTAGGSTASFNLTALEGTIKGSQNNVTVTWFTSGDLITQITSPGSFTTGSTTVYAKVTGTGGCYNKAEVTLTVNRKPEVTSTSLTLCTTPGGSTAVFNLASLESTIIGGQTGVNITWYSNESLTSQITDLNYNSGTTVVYAKVSNAADAGCNNSTAINLTANYQPTATSTNSTQCAGAAGGSIASFDLTALEATVKGSQNNVTVTWFTSSDLITPITSPGSFTTGSTIVYAKVSGIGGCYTQTAVTLTVNRKPEVTSTSQTLCAKTAGGSTAEFNLSSLESTVIGGQTGVNIAWYSNESLTNQVTDLNYSSGTSVVYAKVSNAADLGCYNSTAVNLTANYKPTATATGSVLCASATGGSTASFDLTALEGTVKGSQADVTVSWFTTADLNAGSLITNPTSFSTSGAVVYAKVVNTSVQTCYTATGITLDVKPSYLHVVDTTIWEGDSYILPTGRIVSAPGSYMDKITYGNGCDSLVTTLNLNVRRVERPTTGSVLCEGRSYTLPWGQIVTQPGLYVQTVKDVSGHDSVVNTVNLIMHSPKYRTLNATICDGKSYSMPGGSTVSQTGTFYEILYYTSGCDSLITTLNLTVQKVKQQTNNVVIPAFSSYTLPSGRVVTVAGNYIDTLYYAGSGCDSCIIRTNLAVAGPLPVKFVSISAVKQNGYNKIRWAVTNEENTAYYEVERSNDCIHFTALGKVVYTNPRGQINNYEFMDNETGTANTCYRVKEIDKDGHFEYSEVIFMKFTINGGLAIFPNPAQGVVTLQFSAERKEMAIIQLIDGNGRIAMEKEVGVDQGNNILRLDNLSRFAPGAYSINIKTGSRSLNGRLMIR